MERTTLELLNKAVAMGLDREEALRALDCTLDKFDEDGELIERVPMAEEVLDEETCNIMLNHFESIAEGCEEVKGSLVDVINKNGHIVDCRAAEGFMDDEIREKLNAEMSPCTAQEFFTAYEKAHAEKYGEDWFLSEANPVW